MTDPQIAIAMLMIFILFVGPTAAIFDTLAILGRDAVLRRLDRCVETLGAVTG